MQVFIGADHRGFELKENLRQWLAARNVEVTDCGASRLDEDDDYPDYAIAVARAVAEDPATRRGIVICGSGVGMAVVADKVKGIRAGLIHDPAIAKVAVSDDNINVLALGADFIDSKTAQAVLEAWLGATFSLEERHQRRLQKITQYEHEHSCPCHVKP